MRKEVIPELTKIFLIMLIAFVFLGLLHDVGFTGFSVASLDEPPVYVGPDTFHIQKNSKLTLDLNDHFTDKEELTYLATESSNLTVEVHNNILIIIPDQNFAGERMISIFASDTEEITKKRVQIEIK